jgi:phasin family protein
MRPLGELEQISARLVESGLASGTAFARGVQQIATEAGECSRAACEETAAAMEAIHQAPDLEAAVRLQMEHARSAYAALVGQAVRLTGLYADLARDVYKPFEMPLRRGG